VTQIIGISDFSVVERVPVNLPSRVGRHARIVACHIYTGERALGCGVEPDRDVINYGVIGGKWCVTWERRRRP
jgi:hypothetical protein